MDGIRVKINPLEALQEALGLPAPNFEKPEITVLGGEIPESLVLFKTCINPLGI